MSSTQNYGALGSAFGSYNPSANPYGAMPVDYYLSNNMSTGGMYSSGLPYSSGYAMPYGANPAIDTYNSGGSSNASVPSNTLAMNLGGVNVNYNLGQSTSTIAAQAGQFLNNSFNNDAAFLGQTIIGANSLVSNLTQPLISSAQNQVNFDNSQLPSFYNTLAQENYNLGLGSIAASQQTANASIAASKSAASSAGECYITSAVCETLGLPDDCEILTRLRAFRDGYLKKSAVGRAFVAEYYTCAPRQVERIKTRADVKEYFTMLYTCYILPAVIALARGDSPGAFRMYRRMMYRVRAENA